jgi:cell division protein FtsZ
MDEMGKAMMGTGEASGEDRAVQAAEKAIANPLLDEISLKGARGVLINITGGSDLTLFELDEAANRIREEVDPDANIIVGSTLDDAMEGMMRVSVVATGIDAAQSQADIPTPRRRMAEPLQAAVVLESRPAAVQPPARPGAAEAPAEAAPAAAQAPAIEPRAEEDRNLFNAELAGDDLPPPAYRPAPAPKPGQAASLHVEDEAQGFVAPRPRAPGTPTPEAMARLQAAVSRRPAAGTARAAAQPEARPAAPAASATERPRFGINTLLNRMAGHSAAEAERAAPAMRAQPRVSAAYEEEPEADPDQERIEIPAFLRRQAN